VIAWSTWCGGTLYQMLVVVPIWSSDPPRSVREFFGGTDYARTVRRFFGPPFMVARALPIAIALGLAWDLPEHQCALALALGCVIGAIVHTRVWVYPMNAVLIDRAGAGLTASEVKALARSWIAHDRMRFAVGCVALASLLWAFQLPMPGVNASPVRKAAASDPACDGVDPAEAFLFMGGKELQQLAERCTPQAQ
jgi:hypothetical protein